MNTHETEQLRLPEHAHTARLCLRVPSAGDFARIAEIHADPATNAFNPSGPASPERSRAMLDGWTADWATGVGYWCVRVEENSPVVGVAGVRRLAVHDYNLYYRFAASVWGNGYAREVATFAVDLVLSDPHSRVAALIRPTNAASIRVAEGAGLHLVRSQHDAVGSQQEYAVGAGWWCGSE